MRQLFDHNDEYNGQGESIYNEATEALKIVVEKWSVLGYSPRQIFTIIVEAAYGLACSELLRHNPNSKD